MKNSISNMPDQPLTPRERAEQIASKFLEYVQGLNEKPSEHLASLVESAITAAVLEEREACAKVADAENANVDKQIADIVRGRKIEQLTPDEDFDRLTLFYCGATCEDLAKVIRSRTPHVPQQERGEER